MNKIVITLSGGSDSAVLLYLAANLYDEIHCITFNYRQRHQREVIYADMLRSDIEKLFPQKNIIRKCIDVGFLRELSPTSSLTNDKIETPDVREVRGEAQPLSYVPFRNMMFLSILCSYAESVQANKVWYGAAQADSLAGYWDGDKSFVKRINDLISLNRNNSITVEAPLINMSKKEIVEKGIKLKVPFNHTYTCYSGEYPCDAYSTSSSLRLKGFIDAGYIDPLLYKQQERINQIYKNSNCKFINYIDYPSEISI